MNALKTCLTGRRAALLLTFAALTTALGGCERWALDRQMEELCKKDGGVKVYEKVRDPRIEFSNGAPFFRHTSPNWPQDEYYGPDYRYVVKREILVGKDAKPERGEGRLDRVQSAIYRKVDNKLLGESIVYQRGGGDLFSFGFMPSGNACPLPDEGLAKSIFVKGE